MQEALRETDDRCTFNGLSLGKVYKVYSEANMVAVMLFNGTLLEKVQVFTSYGSSIGGSSVLAIPKYFDNSGKEISMLDRTDPFSPAKTGESDVFVVVGFLGGYLLNPVVLGFLFPEECELLCGRDTKGNNDGSMFLWKHDTSNIYARVAKGDPDGTPAEIEISHPSGLLIKIGSYDGTKTPAEQRTPIVNWDSENELRTFNPLDPVTGKTGAAPYVHIHHPAGTYLTIDTEGTVTINGAKDVGITIEGNVTEDVTGDVDRTIHGNVTETIEGTLNQTVRQNVTQIFGQTGSAYSLTVKGDMTEEVDGDASQTFKEDITETYQGNFTRNVAGTETDTVTGAWNRNSSALIKDNAPSIQHG
jgi:hypothetical protein